MGRAFEVDDGKAGPPLPVDLDDDPHATAVASFTDDNSRYHLSAGPRRQ